MKRIYGIIIFIVSVFALTACNTNENIENDQQLEKEEANQVISESVLDSDFKEKERILDNLKKQRVLEDKFGYNYGVGMTELGQDVKEIALEKTNDKYYLNVSVLDKISFEKEEIDSVVKNMIENDLEVGQLGEFKIYRNAFGKLKENLDFMKTNGVTGIALDIWENYSETSWINENGIPVYIQGPTYYFGEESNETEQDYYVLDSVAENGKYYMLKIQEAGQDGLYCITDESNISQVKIDLLSSDKVCIEKYETRYNENIEDYERVIIESENTNIEEYFEDNLYGKDKVVLNIDINNIKIEDDMIVFFVKDTEKKLKNVLVELLNETPINVKDLTEGNYEYEIGKILLDNVEFTVKISVDVNIFENGERSCFGELTISNEEVVLIENEYLDLEGYLISNDDLIATVSKYNDKYLILDRKTGGNSADIKIYDNKGLKYDLVGFYYGFNVVDGKLIYSSYDGETENVFENYRIDYEFVEENGELKMNKIKEDLPDIQSSDDGGI